MKYTVKFSSDFHTCITVLIIYQWMRVFDIRVLQIATVLHSDSWCTARVPGQSWEWNQTRLGSWRACWTESARTEMWRVCATPCHFPCRILHLTFYCYRYFIVLEIACITNCKNNHRLRGSTFQPSSSPSDAALSGSASADGATGGRVLAQPWRPCTSLACSTDHTRCLAPMPLVR